MTDDDRTREAGKTTKDAVNHARRLLRQARRVVAFSGAGLSAESGIATFRDAATGGLWARHDPMRLATPEGFADDPELVTEWYRARRLALAGAAPNAAHLALAARPGLVNVTQNVDNLLEKAGAGGIAHLHGTLVQDRCAASCGYVEDVDLGNPPRLRRCPDCRAWLRPNVVWFGELLPRDTFASAERACAQCDVLLVIGTSAAVFPAAGLIETARVAAARIIVINTEPATGGRAAEIEILGRAGDTLPALLG